MPRSELGRRSLCATVESAAAAVLGAPPQRVGLPFWTDGALCAEAGIDTVLMGPICAAAHEPVEWVDLDSAPGWPRSSPAPPSPTAAQLSIVIISRCELSTEDTAAWMGDL
jgi:hypothetical protein